MHKYRFYSFDRGYPKRPSIKSRLIIFATGLIIFIFFVGMNMLGVISESRNIMAFTYSCMFVNYMGLEIFYLNIAAKEELSILHEEVLKGYFYGCVYEADIFVSNTINAMIVIYMFLSGLKSLICAFIFCIVITIFFYVYYAKKIVKMSSLIINFIRFIIWDTIVLSFYLTIICGFLI